MGTRVADPHWALTLLLTSRGGLGKLFNLGLRFGMTAHVSLPEMFQGLALNVLCPRKPLVLGPPGWLIILLQSPLLYPKCVSACLQGCWEDLRSFCCLLQHQKHRKWPKHANSCSAFLLSLKCPPRGCK